jgi:hypothetical protein
VKAAESILNLLSMNMQDDHFNSIFDILPSLIEICPIAICHYFENRTMECKWALKHTKGNLKTANPDVEFGVYASPLVPLDQV